MEEIPSLPVTPGAPSLDSGILGFSNPGLEEMSAAQPDTPQPVFEDSTVKLNNMDAGTVALPPLRLNINVNKQEETVKLIEKCLNNQVEAPASSPIWLPTDIKSNILKAQVEAGHKMIRDDVGISHMTSEETTPRSLTAKVSNRPTVQEPPEPQTPPQTALLTSFGSPEMREPKLENMATSCPPPPPDAASQIKTATDDLDALLASLTENLIDLTEPAPSPPPPVMPPLVPSYTAIAPRWLVPSGVLSNGHLGAETSLPAKVLNNVTDAPPAAPETLDVVQVPATTASSAIPKEVTRPRCLLTTEL